MARPSSEPLFDEAVRRLRARRNGPLDADAVGDGVAVLGLVVGGRSYALPLADLAEVTPLGVVTPVPGMPRHLLGVTNLRGEIRPVLNLHALLTLPERGDAAPGYIVYLRSPEREVGLRVDGLDPIRALDHDDPAMLEARSILALDLLKERPGAVPWEHLG